LEATDNEQYFFNFSFFKIDPKWRWMADLAKEESAKEVENIIINSGIRFRTYSTLGLRDDAEFLFWFAAETVEEIQDVISKLYLTVFGKYIIPSRVYLSCTRSSTYARKGTLPSFVLGNEPQKCQPMNFRRLPDQIIKAVKFYGLPITTFPPEYKPDHLFQVNLQH